MKHFRIPIALAVIALVAAVMPQTAQSQEPVLMAQAKQTPPPADPGTPRPEPAKDREGATPAAPADRPGDAAAPAAQRDSDSALPATGSYTPFIGMLGFASVAGAFAVRKLRQRFE